MTRVCVGLCRRTRLRHRRDFATLYEEARTYIQEMFLFVISIAWISLVFREAGVVTWRGHGPSRRLLDGPERLVCVSKGRLTQPVAGRDLQGFVKHLHHKRHHLHRSTLNLREKLFKKAPSSESQKKFYSR